MGWAQLEPQDYRAFLARFLSLRLREAAVGPKGTDGGGPISTCVDLLIGCEAEVDGEVEGIGVVAEGSPVV